MKKRLICLAVIFCMLLSGCTGNRAPSDDGQSGADPVGTEQGNTPDAPFPSVTYTRPEFEGVSTDGWYTVPAYTGTPLIEADPDRTIYISLQNQNCDFYPGMFYAGTLFQIISTEHADPKDIKVTFPMETGYEISIEERTENCYALDPSIGGTAYGLTLDRYMMLKGADWQNIGQGFSDGFAITNIYNDLSLDYPMRSQILEAYQTAYDKVTEVYEEAYNAVTADELPIFYAYYVFVGFRNHCDETVTTATVDFGGRSYTVDFGKWRFHTQRPEWVNVGTDPEGINLVTQTTGLSSLSDNAYTGGYAALDTEFTVRKDITLTGLSAENTDVEVLGGRVVYLNSDDSTGMDFYWDASQLLDIPAGTRIALTVYLHDDCFKSYEVGRSMILRFDYEVAKKEYSMAIPCLLDRQNGFWDTYMMAFLGYDVGEYYTCYAALKDRTFSSMPESWRR